MWRYIDWFAALERFLIGAFVTLGGVVALGLCGLILWLVWSVATP